VASLVVEALRGSVDGVIQVDPAGLAALLKITGPVSIASWPEPIDAENVERIVMHDVYDKWPTAGQEMERTEFGKEVIQTVLAHALFVNIGLSASSIQSLGEATTARHVQIYAAQRAAESLLQDCEAGGALPSGVGVSDVIAVFTNNTAGSKMDWNLRRDVTYGVVVDHGRLQTDMTVALANLAQPSATEPPYVLGNRLHRAELKLNVTVLRGPLTRVISVTVDGRPLTPEFHREGSLVAYSVTMIIPPGTVAHLRMRAEVAGNGTREPQVRLARLPASQPETTNFRDPQKAVQWLAG
jgi:hypothetical protein